MKKIDIRRLYKERHNVAKETLFFLYDTTTVPTTIALAIKINENFYNSDWISENSPDWKTKLMKAMQQIAIIQKTGWAFVEEVEDDYGYPVKKMRCAYCMSEAMEPTKECICRQEIPKFGLSSLGFTLS